MRAQQRGLLAPARVRALLPVAGSQPVVLRVLSAAACGVCCPRGESRSRW